MNKQLLSNPIIRRMVDHLSEKAKLAVVMGQEDMIQVCGRSYVELTGDLQVTAEEVHQAMCKLIRDGRH